ncbi:LysE family translocator [Citrobacter sp. JGM124]|uniref:LysE family translocator n=1 Tax=Citrobacter sp. JGM124 TaxID=2799789 RepID=UPI001BA49C22|nr:LysE family translocator [Citrobacter sp. JGM124]MBS0847316.1 LysE family translocator [Citrobacter sp. JGM124]
MNTPLLGTYILAVILLIMTPGPVVALVTRIAASSGSRRALATVIGTNGASFVLMALAILMLNGVMTLSVLSLAILGLPGSFYIGYLALQGIMMPINTPGKASTGGYKSGVWGGFITGLSNPKDILFFVAFFPQFITVTASFSTSVLVLALIWLVLDFAILSFYILAIKHWVSPDHQRAITLISSWILLVIACVGAVYNGLAVIRAFPS